MAMAGYAGSIAMSGGQIALTSPKAGAVMIFDTAGGYLTTHRRADLCGVAPAARGFTATDGQGAVWACDAIALTLLQSQPTQWDNHLIALG